MRPRRTFNLLAVLTAAACMPATACASPPATLHVSLTPEQLGHPTTLAFQLHINSPRGQSPPAISEMTLDYPSSLGLAVGGLGPVACLPRTLEDFGPEGCPSNAHMGHGYALAEIYLENELIFGRAEIEVLRAPEQQNHVGMYFDVVTHAPMSGEKLVPGVLIPAANQADEALQIKVPLVALWPEGPYVSLVQLNASIGSNGLTYQQHSHGHTINYKPAGILLPDSCPHRGFQFTANLTFITNLHTTIHANVPCPTSTRRR